MLAEEAIFKEKKRKSYGLILEDLDGFVGEARHKCKN